MAQDQTIKCKDCGNACLPGQDYCDDCICYDCSGSNQGNFMYCDICAYAHDPWADEEDDSQYQTGEWLSEMGDIVYPDEEETKK